MKSLNKSAIAVFVFGVFFANTANAAFNVTSDQDNITIIGTQGAGYDLDLMAKDVVIGLQTANDATTKADNAQNTANQAQADATLAGVKATNAQQTALDAGALADTANKKADQALQQNVVNGSNIATLQTDLSSLKTDVSTVDQEAKQAGILADTANNKADTALQGVAKNGADIIAVDAKVDSANTLASTANTNALAADAKATTANTIAISAKAAADHAEITATNANNKADANTAAIATKVDTSTFKADQDRQDQALQDASDKANQAINTGAYAQSLAVDAQMVAAANKAAVANVQSRQQAQETTIQNHSAQLKNHEERITALENESNNNFQNLKDDVDNNRKRAAVGVASVAAMSNIPQVTDSQTFAIGAGAGGYDSQGAVAIGISARVTDHIITKASVGAGSFGGATYGAGVAFGF